MKLLIFGATGGTGRQLVEQALAQEHIVTAFVRTPSKLDCQHPNLQVVQGDVLDNAAVEQAIPGHEAVVSVLGAPAAQTGVVRSEGTRNIISAMEQDGVRRLICQTTLGIGDSRGNLPLYFKYLIVPFILREGFADSERQENHIKQSHLAWTIVRPANLTNGTRTGTYRHGFAGTDRTIKLKVSRADVADFILKQLADDTYLHQTPGVSY